MRGMQAAERLGPFIDSNGVNRSIILLPITTSRPFAFGSAAAPFGVLPIVDAPADGTSFTLGGGSVWFETNLLVPGVATGSFSGFLISGGTLTASATVMQQGGVYVAPVGTTLTVTANLAPPPAGSGSPGGDLTGATIALPASVTIVFTQSSATIEALGGSSVKLYGREVGLTWNNAAPTALTGFPAILIPCKASVAAFDFASVASKVFVPAGTATINAAGWSLPIAVTTLAQLGAASGAGSLVLELGAGASLVCATRPGKAAIGGWLVGIDPTQLIVIAGGDRSGRCDRLHALAGSAAGARSEHGRLGQSRRLHRQPAGDARHGVAGSVRRGGRVPGPAACGRRRRTADGRQRLAVPHGHTRHRRRSRSSPQPATPPTTTFTLALENALIGVHAPRTFLVAGALANAGRDAAHERHRHILLDARWVVPTLPDPYAASFDARAADRPAVDRRVGECC